MKRAWVRDGPAAEHDHEAKVNVTEIATNGQNEFRLLPLRKLYMHDLARPLASREAKLEEELAE